MAWPGRHTGRVRIYLMWARGTRTGAGLDPEVVARSLQGVLAPLFTAPPPVAIEANAAAAMVFMQLPVRGWAAPFVQEDDHGRAYVTDHPVGLRRALEGRGARPRRDAELPALARRLAADPTSPRASTCGSR